MPYVTVKSLIKRLQQLPPDSYVELEFDVFDANTGTAQVHYGQISSVKAYKCPLNPEHKHVLITTISPTIYEYFKHTYEGRRYE